MKQYHNRFLLSFKNFEYIKKTSHILKSQNNVENLSLKDSFRVNSNDLLNFSSYLISPLIVLFISISKFIKALFCNPDIIVDNLGGKRLFVNNNTSFYARTKVQLHRDDIILSFQTPLKIEDFQNIEITELVSKRDTVRAFNLAIHSLWYLTKNYGYWSCMYALNAFDCYMLMIALDNLPNDITLITDAQIDRLAYILDSAKQTNKEIIMHGSLFIHGQPPKALLPYVIYNSGTCEWCYKMPTRLNSISRVYSFSQKEGNYFKLCTMVPDSNPTIVEVGYGTKFSKITKSTHRLDILLIANETMINHEIKVCNILYRNGYNTFIQIHPLSDATKYKSLGNKYMTMILKESQRNPLVEIVISYGSTLAHEYEAIGIPVIYYTDYIENNNLNEIELIEAINEYEKKQESSF